jgi:uncharacterized protein (TIGR02217 family)
VSFHDIQMPTVFSSGSLFGAGFNTKLVELRNGQGTATQFWPNGRRRFNIGRNIAAIADSAAQARALTTLFTFYLARGGRANTFRFKDWLDYATTSTGMTGGTNPAVTAIDQTLVALSATQFQMVKRYTSGPTTIVRALTMLVSGTVLVSVNDVTQSSGFTVDLISGVVTFTAAPAGTVKGGCQFDVHARFGEGADRAFQVGVELANIGSIGEIDVNEELGVAPFNHDIDFGGAQDHGNMNGADVQLNAAGARLNIVQPGVTSLAVILPDPLNLPDGGPWFVIANKGTQAVAIESSTGTTVVGSLAVNAVVELWLGVQSGTKTWYPL